MHWSIIADSVFLKNGKVIEGHIIQDSDKELFIKTAKGKEKILRADISEVKIGVNAVSSCYILKKNPESEICSKKLIYLSDKTAKFVKSIEDDIPESYVLNEISKLEIRNIPGENFLTMIRDNSNVIVRLQSQTMKGTILLHSIEDVQIKTDTGLIKKINLNEIASILIKSDPVKVIENPEVSIKDYFIPGLRQYRQNKKLKSMIFMSSTILIMGGIATEFNMAMNSKETRDYSFFPAQGSYYIFEEHNKKNFEMHKRNYSFLLGCLALTYFFNFLDIYNKTDPPLSFGINFHPSINSNKQLSSNFEIQYSIRF